MGLTLQAKGDLAGALAAYREGRGIARELAAKDRDDIRWRALNTAAIPVPMIDLLKAQGDFNGALAACRATHPRACLRIPIDARQIFRREAGRRSDLMPATVPK